MNPRRVHELMRKHFPAGNAAARDWIVVADEHCRCRDVLGGLLSKFIAADEVLIEVHRRKGDLLRADAAADFIATHLGQGDIRISDREFQGLAVVAIDRVAVGWHKAT